MGAARVRHADKHRSKQRGREDARSSASEGSQSVSRGRARVARPAAGGRRHLRQFPRVTPARRVSRPQPPHLKQPGNEPPGEGDHPTPALLRGAAAGAESERWCSSWSSLRAMAVWPLTSS